MNLASVEPLAATVHVLDFQQPAPEQKAETKPEMHLLFLSLDLQPVSTKPVTRPHQTLPMLQGRADVVVGD